MKKIAIMVFLTLLAMPCIAEQDSIITGPYNVSFDLGIPSNAYSLNIGVPTEGVDPSDGKKYIAYNIAIGNKTGLTRIVTISMVEYEEDLIIPNATDMKRVITKMAPSSSNVRERVIDGFNGVIASIHSTDESKFLAVYYPCNRTIAVIISNYPWEEGTLQLLKTISIENINLAT